MPMSVKSCEQFEARLNALLDERRFPEQDAALQAHAAVCAECRASLAVQGRLWASLSASQLSRPAPRQDVRPLSPPPGASLRSTSVRARQGAADFRRASPVRTWLVGGAVAALVLAAVVGGNRIGRWSGLRAPASRSLAYDGSMMLRRSGTPRRSGTQPHQWALGQPDIGRSRTGPLAGQPGVEPSQLPPEARAAVSVFPSLPIRWPDLDAAKIAEAGPLKGVQELSAGIRPLADSMGTVMSIFWPNSTGGTEASGDSRSPDTSAVSPMSWVS